VKVAVRRVAFVEQECADYISGRIAAREVA
jgi:hypothetical protein